MQKLAREPAQMAAYKEAKYFANNN